MIEKEQGIFDLRMLKYRERDDVESVLKFWKGTKPFEIGKLWESRSRIYFGQRYDSKDNLMDWDFHFRLNARNIHKKEYLKWRQSGIAFVASDEDYSVPNRTMATVAMIGGQARWGYFG